MFTPLHIAAKEGCSESIAKLLDAGANLEAQDENGFIPLHVAAMYGNPEAVAALLDAGANIEARNLGDRTPLHRAGWGGSPENVMVLLDAGADPNARDGDGAGRGRPDPAAPGGTVRHPGNRGGAARCRVPADLAEDN